MKTPCNRWWLKRSPLIGMECDNCVIAKFRTAAKRHQFDEYEVADDDAAGELNEFVDSSHGTAGGEYVVDHEHPLPRRDGVGMHLNCRAAVFERIGHCMTGGGQFASLAHGHESRTQGDGDCRRENEPTGFDADDLVH